jgi:hypothetical protein
MPLYKLTDFVHLIGWPGVIYSADNKEFPLYRNILWVGYYNLIIIEPLRLSGLEAGCCSVD